MARAGAFDPTLVPAGWYDESSVVEGFFDGDFIPFPVSGGYTLTALVGTYLISGQPAILLHSRVLLPTAGTYAINGQPAILTHAGGGAYLITALKGTYLVTGQNAILTWAGGPSPAGNLQDYIELRSFTERRGFY